MLMTINYLYIISYPMSPKDYNSKQINMINKIEHFSRIIMKIDRSQIRN